MKKQNPIKRLFGIRGMGGAMTAFAGLIIIYIAFGIINPTVFSGQNIMNLLRSMSKYLIIGIGQSYVNVTSSRVFNTTYTNSTAKMIFVLCTTVYSSGGMDCKVYINNDEVCAIINDGDGSVNAWVTFPVPAGASYRVSSSRAMQTWWEVR